YAVDLDFRLDAKDISDLGAVGEDLGVDYALGLSRSSSAPGIASVAPVAGQFDVETIRHAPVKLPAGALLAKREALRGTGGARAAGRLAMRYNLSCGTRRRKRPAGTRRPACRNGGRSARIGPRRGAAEPFSIRPSRLSGGHRASRRGLSTGLDPR